MNAEDMAILDRIERLAFQAGLASRNDTKAESKPVLKPEAEVVLRKLAKIGKTCNLIGAAVYGSTVEDNVNYEELIALGRVM
jgi:hypothetical protein